MKNKKKPNQIDMVDEIITDAVDRGIVQLNTEDDVFCGRIITISGKELINFGSCSYLGLELTPQLKDGAIDAINRFGTQYSSSRAFVSSGQYLQLESLLEDIFSNTAIATATTTLGHISAIPVLIEDGDAVILDQQVHASVQTATQLLKPRGIHVGVIAHNNLGHLRKKLKALKNSHNRIWYMIDGVYSMYGDVAPLPELLNLLDEYEQLYLYCDDAHGMSWAGENGQGYALSQVSQHPKMVVATSMNKAFASAGGVLIFPNKEWARKVRTCGGTMIFSGPIQPPMLGAAIASAKLHLSRDFSILQKSLSDNIEYTNRLLKFKGLPLCSESVSPIFFIGAGLPRVAYNIVKRMLNEGYYMNAAAFPAVAVRRGGVRFTITALLTKSDITSMVETLAYHYPLALIDEGTSLQEVSQIFGLSHNLLAEPEVVPTDCANIHVQHESSIHQIDAESWNVLLGESGTYDWVGMKFLEKVFQGHEEPESNWKFHYLIIRDQAGEVILATFFTVALVKDDMFSSASISSQIEKERKDSPYYLSSTQVMMGSLATEGQHLYIDRSHPSWMLALEKMLDLMVDVQKDVSADAIVLRDFVKDSDEELKSYLFEQGFYETVLPDNNVVSNMEWNSLNEYMSRLGKSSRQNLRRSVLKKQDDFDVQFGSNASIAFVDHCYKLYKEVQAKGMEINSFVLPKKLFEMMMTSPQWDIMSIYMNKNDTTDQNNQEKLPILVCFSYKGRSKYTPLIVGMDYGYVQSHGSYKQMLYQAVQRARSLGYRDMNFGFSASFAKYQVGAHAVPTVAYVQLENTLNQEIINNYSSKS